MRAAKAIEFRCRALDLVAAGGPVAKIARDFGISQSYLRGWMEHADVDAGGVDGLTSAEKRKLVELRRRNRVLETEIEILKRASANLARENILPT